MTPTGGAAKKRVRQVRGPADPLDAAVGLVDHLTKRRAGEVGELHSLEAGPQPLDRVEVGRVAGSRSTTSQCRWLFSQARMAALRWAGRPSHSSVAFSPPRNVRSSPRTWIRLAVYRVGLAAGLLGMLVRDSGS
jgi:hypothetical protein